MRRSLLLVLAACVPAPAADAVVIRLNAVVPPAVEVTGLPPTLMEALKASKPDSATWAAVRVTVADGKATVDTPAVLGSWRTDGDRLRFDPRFPLVPGLSYRFTFDPTTAAEFRVPQTERTPTAAVTNVYPTAARLPENTLRLYVQFSAPMSRGGAYRYLTLLDAAGTPLVSPPPFLELGEELWSADGTRFTLFFDPARVKRGLVPREEDGPTLTAGKRYTLVVSPEWPDADGRPLRSGFRKSFAVGPPDEEPIDPAAWALSPPARSGDALVVRLPKPLDRGLLQRLVWVTDAAGKRVEGAVSVGGGERVLSFAPAGDWQPGNYRLVVDARLEDPCGNRVGEAFEVDETKPPRATATGTFTRPFAAR